MEQSQKTTMSEAEQPLDSMEGIEWIEEFLQHRPSFFDPPLFALTNGDHKSRAANLSFQSDVSQNEGMHNPNQESGAADTAQSTMENDLIQIFNDRIWETTTTEQDPQAAYAVTRMDMTLADPELQDNSSTQTTIDLSSPIDDIQTAPAGLSGPLQTPPRRIRVKRFPCEVEGCEHAFCFPKDLRRHHTDVHDKEVSKRFKCHVEGCPQRERGYNRRDALMRHVRIKHEAAEELRC